MLRIAHISDIHIRNLKFHDEYTAAFENLYRELRELKPDLIVNTGDTAHTKTQISPELVQMMSDFFRNLSNIAPLHIILGNHDLNLMNLDRQDAISPVVDSLKSDRIFLHKKSGLYKTHIPNLNFWIFSMADSENYPKQDDWNDYQQSINIGLFHGSVINCMTDSDWTMTAAEVDLSIFKNLDYVLMGDIHKRQSFNDGKIAYPGSLIQQNFGEDPEKGYLIWNIKGKNDFSSEFKPLKGSRGFYTVFLDEDGSIPANISIPDDTRIRVISKKNLNLVEQKDVERNIRNRFKPKDIVSITSPETTFSARKEKTVLTSKNENIRSLDIQEKLIRDFFKESNLDEKVLEKINSINKKFQIEIEQDEEVVRNVFWNVNKIGWSNMFNYGSGNYIDFSKIKGFTGIFAPNTSGKSSIFEIFMEGLFDKVTKDVSKNIELINDNKEFAKIVIDLSIGEQNYVVERTIEKIKPTNKKNEQKEWGKTALDFFINDEDYKSSLNGVSRPETERAIRKRIGSFEDFVLSTISAQEPITGIPGGANLISCKETDRKKILCRFLDLDIFDQKCNLARTESKKFIDRLEELQQNDIVKLLKEYRTKRDEFKVDIEVLEKDKKLNERKIEILDNRLLELFSSFMKINVTRTQTSIEQDIKTCNNDINLISKAIFDLKKIIDDKKLSLSIKKQDCDIDDAYDIDDKLLKLTKKLGAIENEIDKLKNSLLNKKKKLKLLDEVPCGTQYQQCKFLVDAFDAKKTIDTDGELLKSLQDKQLAEIKLSLEEEYEKKQVLQDIYALKTDINYLELDFSKEEIKRSELDNKLSNLNKELLSVIESKDAIKHNDEVKQQIFEVEAAKKAIKEQLIIINNEILKLNRQHGADMTLLERLEQEYSDIEELKTTCLAYENYIEAMGKHGIAYRILAQKLPIINDEINKILSNVVNFSVFLEHDPQDQTIKLYLQYGDYRSRNLGLSSGAEKFISSLAIRAALLNVSSLPKTNMFVVDEGFGKLDNSHLESIQKMFHYLRTIFEHVIVISHVDVLKDMVDNSIEITTDKEGYAHVEVT